MKDIKLKIFGIGTIIMVIILGSYYANQYLNQRDLQGRLITTNPLSCEENLEVMQNLLSDCQNRLEQVSAR